MRINDLPITFALIIPCQIAEFEHGFSCQNSTKTNRRNKVKEKHLNVLMKLKTSKCSVADFDYDLAINIWKEKKAHRVYKNVSYQ